MWWARLPPPAGRRPVLLLSRNRVYQVRASVTVAFVTRTIRRIPAEVILDTTDGLPSRCVVNLDDIYTVPKALLDERITLLSQDKMAQVRRAILFALDLEED